MKLPALPDRSNLMVFSDGPSCGSAYSPLVMLLQGQTLVTLNHGRRCAALLIREGKQIAGDLCVMALSSHHNWGYQGCKLNKTHIQE